jgi:branched-chain amino acid transport system ATP-binding protein
VSTSAAPASQAPATGRTAVLEADGVIMRFGGLVAVDDVSMRVHEGEIVGLIGPNGAGKTTFFNCLTGMYVPTEGTVRLHGETLPPKPRAVVTAGMARTFQNIRLFANMTALENVMVGRYCRTSSMAITSILRGPKFRREEDATRARAQELLEFVGLAKSTELLARNMPYGDQRRLEIARALATDPKVLLLDEPTAGMNPRETEETMNLIFRIRDDGLAVVVIEHDMRFIFGLCDRVLCLVRGALLVEGTPAEVQSDHRVIEAYIGGDDEDEPGTEGGATVAAPGPAAPGSTAPGPAAPGADGGSGR